MSVPRVYHNPRCSKSRSACALLEAHGVQAEVVDYLKTPPSREELQSILRKLGLRPQQLIRTGEAVFKEHYAGQTLDDDGWLDALQAHPVLMERPLVVWGEQAVIGRPPENVLTLLRNISR